MEPKNRHTEDFNPPPPIPTSYNGIRWIDSKDPPVVFYNPPPNTLRESWRDGYLMWPGGGNLTTTQKKVHLSSSNYQSCFDQCDRAQDCAAVSVPANKDGSTVPVDNVCVTLHRAVAFEGDWSPPIDPKWDLHLKRQQSGVGKISQAMDGAAVTCAIYNKKNDPMTKKIEKGVHRYDKTKNQLRWYPTPMVADSWDRFWRSPLKVGECTDASTGPELTHQAMEKAAADKAAADKAAADKAAADKAAADKAAADKAAADKAAADKAAAAKAAADKAAADKAAKAAAAEKTAKAAADKAADKAATAATAKGLAADKTPCSAANPEWVKAALPALGATFGPVSPLLERQYRDRNYRYGASTYAESIAARRKAVGVYLLDKKTDKSLTCLYQKAAGPEKDLLKKRMDESSAEYVFLLQLEKDETTQKVAAAHADLTAAKKQTIVPADRGTMREQARQTQDAVLQKTAKVIVAHTEQAAVQAALDAHARPTAANQTKAVHHDALARGAKQIALTQGPLEKIVRDMKQFVHTSLAAGRYTITIRL